MKIPEKVIQLQILKYLRLRGAVCGKTKTMGTPLKQGFRFDPYNFRGFPDITFFLNNRIGFVECKAKGNKQSPEQAQFQELCSKAGIPYILARSLEDVEKTI